MAKTAPFSSIEALESRIAPALLVVGANLLGGENPKTGESSVGGNAVTLIKVLSGTAIAWYDGVHITSVSFGPNTNLDLTGNIGDLVGNLDANGRLSDSDGNPLNGEDGNVLLANNLTGVTTHQLSEERGDIHSVITGGTISNVNVHGHLSGLYAGDAVFRAESFEQSSGAVRVETFLTINPLNPASDTGFNFDAANAKNKITQSASIQKVTVAIATELQMFAGNGGDKSSNGGNVNNVHIVSSFINVGSDADTPSYYLRGGDGANGVKGGAGGQVFNVYEETSNNIVLIDGGKGGNGTTGAGGPGGNVHDLDLQGDSATYTVRGGDGGHGVGGGAGGSVTKSNFSGKKPNTGVIVAADFNNDGLDDILVVDSNTGNMVISAQTPQATFQPLAQYYDPDFDGVIDHDGDGLVDPDEVVTIIKGIGNTPVSAVALDVNGDGLLDIAVAYKNSNSVGVFINHGGGSFWISDKKTFDGAATGLKVSPTKLVTGDFSGSSALDIAVMEDSQGRGQAEVLVTDGTGKLSLMPGSVSFPSAVTAAAASAKGGTFYVGTSLGSLYAVNTAGGSLNATLTGASLSGAVATLAVDATGSTMVAVGVDGSATLFDVSSSSVVKRGPLDVSGLAGRAINAKFAYDNGPDEAASIVVLASGGSSSQLGLFTQDDAGAFSLAQSISAPTVYKNFDVAYQYDGSHNFLGYGVGSLSGSLNSFAYSPELSGFDTYSLPFSGKKVKVFGGTGGHGDNAGRGGAGGAINTINIDANEAQLFAGFGASSDSGAGGNGGSISNTASFVTYNGLVVKPAIKADTILKVTAGDGGSVLNAGGATSSGGTGGLVSGLNLQLAAGDIIIFTGSGGDGRGGTGGNAGNLSTVTATNFYGGLAVTAGHGGDALSGNMRAGTGGSISGLNFAMATDDASESAESAFNVSLIAGDGGKAPAGTAGMGGSITSATLFLDGPDRSYDDPLSDPPKSDANRDTTISVLLHAGSGGLGAVGGSGGNLTSIVSNSFFDQPAPIGYFVNYVVMTMEAGNGGNGSTGLGGNGGSISLNPAKPFQGITTYDKDAATPALAPLVVTAGFGGDGGTKGGFGGSVSGLVVQNSPYLTNTSLTTTHLGGAIITAGHGGAGGTEGGRGGSLSGLKLAAQSDISGEDGSIHATAGAGGGGPIGGAGGSITGSYFGSVDGDLRLDAGAGGAGGSLGGKGGALTGLTLNAAQLSEGVFVKLRAGAGGSASANGGRGGDGGSISGVTQQKDINSAIDLLQAGNGGAAASGIGGKGGSVSAVKTSGFIGKPVDGGVFLGAFGSDGEAQGIFSGRGGAGATNGTAGGVTGVVARQIAAIAAAYDTTAQTFAIASIVSGVKADAIAYDIATIGSFDGGGSPSTAKPTDGFILAATTSNITKMPAPQFVFAS